MVDLAESEPICTYHRLRVGKSLIYTCLLPVDSTVTFWEPEVKIGQPVAFQICMTAPCVISLSALPFVSLRIYYADNFPPVVVRHTPPASNTPSESQQQQIVRRIDLGHLHLQSANPKERQVDANLRWPRGGSLVLVGSLSSDAPLQTKVSPDLSSSNSKCEHSSRSQKRSSCCGKAAGTSKYRLTPPRLVQVCFQARSG